MVGFFVQTKNVISSRAATTHSACFVWKILLLSLLSPDRPPILPFPHSCFPPTVLVKDFPLRLPTPCAPDFLPMLTSPCLSYALMWTATFVSGSLQVHKPLMQALELISVFVVSILIFHSASFLLILFQGQIQRASEGFQLPSGQIKYLSIAWTA